MGWCRSARRGIAAIALTLLTGSARADPPNESSAVARSLFDQGRALLAAKDYDAACPKFAEAQRLDPGGGTILNLALCNELRGMTATAWAQYDEALRWARRDHRPDREKFAQHHRAALEPRLLHLRVLVAVAARVPGLLVRYDDTGLGEASWGEWIPVDPGKHVITAAAAGKVTLRQSIEIDASKRQGEIVITALEDVPRAPAPAPAPLPRRQAPVVRARPVPAPRDVPGDAGPQRLLGLVLGGMGVVALGASAYFGVRATRLESGASELCPSSGACEPTAFDVNRDAHRAADIATGFAVAGIVTAGVGAYLFFSAPSTRTPGAAVAIGADGARVVGRF